MHRFLAERLISPEAHDGQSQRIDGQLVVLHVLAEDIGDAGSPSFALDLGMICRVRKHLLEFDPRRIWRLPEIVKNNILDLDIDVRERTLLDVGLDDIVLALLIDDEVLHIAVQEIECVGLIALDGEAIATEIELSPAREVILVLNLLRAVLEVAIVDRLGASDIVDAHDHGVHVGERTLALVHKGRQTDRTIARTRIVTFK